MWFIIGLVGAFIMFRLYAYGHRKHFELLQTEDGFFTFLGIQILCGFAVFGIVVCVIMMIYGTVRFVLQLL